MAYRHIQMGTRVRAAVPGCVTTRVWTWSLIHAAATINLRESAVNTLELGIYCARVDDRRGV